MPLPLVRNFFLLVIALLFSAASFAREAISLNPGWHFLLGDPGEKSAAETFSTEGWDLVSLPHTHEIFPSDLAGFKARGRNIGWYRRDFSVAQEWSGRRLFLVFHGSMQSTKVWVNGRPAGEYSVSGYDSFHFDVTSLVRPGKNSLAVRVDNTVNPDIPPDFLKTDFMQFGGLYRDVDLVVTDAVYVTFPWEAKAAGLRFTLPEISVANAVLAAETTVRNTTPRLQSVLVRTTVFDATGKPITVADSTQAVAPGADTTFSVRTPAILKPELWSPDRPYLYRIETSVIIGGKVVDRIVTPYGFRWFEFTKDRGFFLNGEPLKLIGANRHQTWPFIGNAVPAGLHRIDAAQLKAMGCNWVRLSHYPHDPKFLAMLDELGLLALAEGPTWWGAGNDQWMRNLQESFRRMIRRDRNHSSIIIWNTCLNHGGAERSLVEIAKEEDPTRARGQDNVPAVMDFSHGKVSGNGALTIEHTGHTFPVARGERAIGNHSNREYEQVRRHWEQTNASYLKVDNVGMAVWAAYDYNTFHNDNDGIARHGVLDLFRLPKYSFWWHQSELTAAPMAYVLRVDSDTACVFSNAVAVRLRQDTGSGYDLGVVQKPDTGFVLKHPPFHFAIDPAAVALKAEALVNGKVVATHEWRRAGAPAALTLTTERASFSADGADLTRVVVSAVDASGTLVEDSSLPVRFTLSGPGQLIGETPARLRAGRFIVLVQSGFSPGSLTLTAEADGLKSTSLALQTTALSGRVDFNPAFAKLSPTRSNRIVLPPAAQAPEGSWFALKSKRDVQRNAWIESDAILVPGEIPSAPVSIRGGEYRIYTSEWSSKPGKVVSGDALYVRVKSRGGDDQSSWVELTVGDIKTRFEVTTPKKSK